MWNFENKNFEPKIKKPKNPEKEILNIENREIPEQKYIKICEEIWKDQKFLEQISSSLNFNLKLALEDKNIDFQALLEDKTGQKLNLA